MAIIIVTCHLQHFTVFTALCMHAWGAIARAMSACLSGVTLMNPDHKKQQNKKNICTNIVQIFFN